MIDAETKRRALELVKTIRTSTLIKWMLDEDLRYRTLRAYGVLPDGIPLGVDEFARRQETGTAFLNAIEDEVDERCGI